MNKHDQNGSVNALLLPVIVLSLLFLGSAGFGAWAYMERQDYKLNVDEKIAAAVKLARVDEGTKKDKQFAEERKNPLRSYQGPSEYGSLQVEYPDTWSAYIDNAGGSTPLNGYFYPGVVPSITGEGSSFALRIKVLAQSYESSLRQFASLEKSGKVTVAPYSLPKVPDVIGVKIDGEIKAGQAGTIIVLPLRDKSIQISTEGTEFTSDFNDNILPNVTFSP